MPEYDATRFTPPAPLASVTLINSGTGRAVENVPMLLDTGADVTLVPADALLTLGVATLPAAYSLQAFNGTPVTAAAADLNLRFLGRVFRGRFLLLDQPIGILGRNVLNHLVLLLDGPSLLWQEFVGPEMTPPGR